MKILFTIICWACLAIPAAAKAEPIKLATGEWAPYVSESLEKKGFLMEIISEVFKEMHLEADYVFYPWRRCYESVVMGKVWAAFPYSYTKERAEEVLFSDKITFSVTRFFTHKTSKGYQLAEKPGSYNTLSDLKPYRIGGVIGYFYEQDFNRAGLHMDYVSKEIHAIEKLIMGRIDFFPVNELVGWYIIKNNFSNHAERFSVLEKPYSTNDLNLIVSKKYPDAINLLKRFNAALEIVKDRYIYKSILERYQQ